MTESLYKRGCNGDFGTDHLGRVYLDNGWVVSIQAKRMGIYAGDNTYEIWSWEDSSREMKFPSNNTYPKDVLGWQSHEEVREFIQKVKTF